MKIQLLSDLHLEVHPHFVPQPTPGADVLVLAGDIGSYQSGSLLDAMGDSDFGLGRFAHWPVPVIFVPGNHEYDAQDFDAAHARLRATVERLGLSVRERESVVLHGVRFVGTTLWSDFDALAEHEGSSDLVRRLRQRDKAFRAANFYLKKTGGTRAEAAFLAPAVREQGLLCQQWLRETLATAFDGPTVAVTHFAPSLHSADPRYGLVPGTAGFCNALDDCLAPVQLWLHGHLHAPLDYTVQGAHPSGTPWQCRVVANPLGYARKGEQSAFVAQNCINL